MPLCHFAVPDVSPVDCFSLFIIPRVWTAGYPMSAPRGCLSFPLHLLMVYMAGIPVSCGQIGTRLFVILQTQEAINKNEIITF